MVLNKLVPDLDRFHPHLLCKAAAQITEPSDYHAYVYQSSGILPDEQKLGYLIPIYKEGIQM